MTAAADTIVLDRLRAAGVRGRHRRITWSNWVTSARVAFRARYLFLTSLVLAMFTMVGFTCGYVVLNTWQFRHEQRVFACQTVLNQQLRDPRAGLPAVCDSLTVGVKLQGPPVNRDTTTATPSGPVKTPMH